MLCHVTAPHTGASHLRRRDLRTGETFTELWPTMLTLDEGPDVLAVEGFKHGQLLGELEQVRGAERTYDLLAAVALSPAHSIDLIARIAKDLST